MALASEILTGKSIEDLSALEKRVLIDELYADYVACLDEDEVERWPDFFIDDCMYKIVARENFERGLPVATMLCESKGYLLDRVQAIRETSTFAPRRLRHLVGGIQIREAPGDQLKVEANYAVFQTLADEETSIFITGRYFDTLVVLDGSLKFAEKLCVYDSALIPNSLIYPL